jgi:hypothetical protein
LSRQQTSFPLVDFIMLSVIMLNAIMANVMAPEKSLTLKDIVFQLSSVFMLNVIYAEGH